MSQTERERSRRNFMKGLGVAAGATAFSTFPTEASASLAQVPERTTRNGFPELNRRAQGWLRFLWDKTTTEDDWGAHGVPHPWWDRYSSPVVTSYGRFDLHNSSYALLLMADQTPAWREAYTEIADGLARRYPTYWGAIDWLTQIGDDPKRANYPPRVMAAIPDRLQGNYNRIGWTANGIEPWGLAEDPIAADGNLFFRAWFNVVLSIYRYVSGDNKYEQPFKVTGYGDQEFEWDQHRICERLAEQYREHPEGPQCENTKIWVVCNSAGGLGLYLYDRIFGAETHRPFQNFLEYTKDNYMSVSNDGKLEWITQYYDPIANHNSTRGPAGGVGSAFLLLPQDRELATFLYESASNALGWNNPRVPIQANASGLNMARALGDHTAIARLSAAAEREFDPRFFGEHEEKFGWWFGLNEGFPRGQRSASMMVSEIGANESWPRAFDAPHLDKFEAPTVEGIDFPSLGVSQAWNDTGNGTLYVTTYATTPDRRGVDTSWRVTNLANPDDVFVLCDGEPFERVEVEGTDTIRLDTTIDNRQYQIFTGYRGETSAAVNPARTRPQRRPTAAATGLTATASRPTTEATERIRTATTDLFPTGGPSCGGCC